MKNSRIVFFLFCSLFLLSCGNKGEERESMISEEFKNFDKLRDEYCDCVMKSEDDCSEIEKKVADSDQKLFDLFGHPAHEELGAEVFKMLSDQNDKKRDDYLTCKEGDALMRKVLIKGNYDNWEEGTRQGKCDDGYMVVRADGTSACEKEKNIVWNGLPKPGEIHVGDSVLCMWSTGIWTLGYVNEIKGEQFHCTVYGDKARTVGYDGIAVRRLKSDF